MIDIGANLTDPVFTGLYRGKQKHEVTCHGSEGLFISLHALTCCCFLAIQSDLTAILARAKTFGVDKIIVTGGNLEESHKALQLAKDKEDMISKNRSRFSNGVVHSFTGEKEEMLKLVELGLYIDAPWCDIRATHAGHGHVKTSWQSKKAEKYAPDCLVKGRNEPCTLIQVLEIISAIRGEDQEAVAARVLENTENVFFKNE
ncbi:Xylose isomerase [Phytophthora nicotianae]|uniref:Xylose isomerase n=1 Tax=Phytophthora nicotianae TaxID=4792 RepID=A0A0W8DFX0_PHYNI|nr:Xylose isomerase [Phytophthora nicotianae]